MFKYRKGQLGENNLIVESINESFSDVRNNPDFRLSMPKVFKEEGLEHLSALAIDSTNSTIAGSLTTYPTTFNYQDLNINLKAAYIGSVGVRPQYRNQGIMSNLLTDELRVIENSNYDFAILSGQRQRYQNFQFYPFGYMYKFLFTKTNYYHLKAKSNNVYTFNEVINDDDMILEKIYQLYSQKTVTTRSKDRFLDSLRSRSLKVFTILDNNNAFQGYILLRYDREIHEIELSNFTLIKNVLSDFQRYLKTDALDIIILSYELNKFNYFNQFCENYITYQTEFINVFNYINTLKFMFELTNKYRRLEDGELIIEINEVQTIMIKIANYKISISESNLKSNIILNKEDFTQLTLPHAGDTIINYKNWFPLLFSVALADTF